MLHADGTVDACILNAEACTFHPYFTVKICNLFLVNINTHLKSSVRVSIIYLIYLYLFIAFPCILFAHMLLLRSTIAYLLIFLHDA